VSWAPRDFEPEGRRFESCRAHHEISALPEPKRTPLRAALAPRELGRRAGLFARRRGPWL